MCNFMKPRYALTTNHLKGASLSKIILKAKFGEVGAGVPLRGRIELVEHRHGGRDKPSRAVHLAGREGGLHVAVEKCEHSGVSQGRWV